MVRRRPSGCLLLLALLLVWITVRATAAAVTTGVPPWELIRPCPGDTGLPSRGYLGRCPHDPPPAPATTIRARHDEGEDR
jgi:hypothetical protein